MESEGRPDCTARCPMIAILSAGTVIATDSIPSQTRFCLRGISTALETAGLVAM